MCTVILIVIKSRTAANAIKFNGSRRITQCTKHAGFFFHIRFLHASANMKGHKMTKQAQISCVTPDGVDQDFRLDSVGGDINGVYWKNSIDVAIKHIDSGEWEFFTYENGHRAKVIVRTHPTSLRRYLTTTPDGYTANNLCKLRSC